MDRLLRMAFEKLIRTGTFFGSQPRQDRPSRSGMRRGPPWRSASPHGPPSDASLSIPSSDSAKPTWTAASSSSRAQSRIFSTSPSKTSTGCNRTRGLARWGHCGRSHADSFKATRSGARDTIRSIITISIAESIACFWIPTCNIRAHISKTAALA
jgi:hypothetical protein